MQYIHVPTRQEYDQLMDIFEKKGWTWSSGSNPKKFDWFSHDRMTCISNEDWFGFNNICYVKRFDECISFQDYLKQESILSITDDANTIKFWDLVDVRDSDDDVWLRKYYYVASVEWVYMAVLNQVHLDAIKDWSRVSYVYSYKQVRKHEEEKVTITITKSEYEKVKEFLNK